MAHACHATVSWARGDAVFRDGRDSRGHGRIFDRLSVPGMAPLAALASRHAKSGTFFRDPGFETFAKAPRGLDTKPVLIKWISYHLLSFLDFGCRIGFVVDSSRAAMAGEMTPNAAGKRDVAGITLRSAPRFSGERRPTAGQVDHLHHRAHENCHMAHVLRSDVIIAPVPPSGAGDAHQDLQS